MAAVQSQPRLSQPSDPFVDPAVPHRPPPPPPPKSKHSSKMSTPAAAPPVSSKDPNPHDITEAVRETVTVRGNADSSPRTRVGRSQTTLNPASSSTAARPSGRRSQSQDSAPTPEKEKQKSSGKSRSKKGSQHADVIDRLDFTGVGPMFHHDGPFDACAPSRNRQRNKAPMFAWSVRPEELSMQPHEGAYPAPHVYRGFSNDYVDAPKKKVDAIAEAWGIHEPEPFEEFYAGGGTSRPEGDTPASSIYNGKDAHSRNGAAKRSKDHRDARESIEEGNSSTRPQAAVRRSGVPPPQPIFVPGSGMEPIEAIGGSPPAPGAPKRTKSLMHRIRKMRDSPNVPLASEREEPPSPSSPMDSSAPRPTHRPQNSFLGRLGGGGPRQNPTTPPASGDRPEPYIFIDHQANKDLPATPQFTASDSTNGALAESPSNEAGPGLGRKTSLIKKVGRVVRGAR
ncbi:hypothetical protein BDN72DRAFT_830326 [Pluteus cervinus]|uniref:Uncharacterized protein n=1 Tax=Pluteus cervinus TaxID=181527 RepID=A0ACD3BHM1_9AGAR|nr:hypothetical protein BDN72DRAFT_830326 [Pluteus cervinus]